MEKPSLVFNEPIATGWVRMELYGDAQEAKSHIHAARKQLGMMRAMYGVNERIAHGEPGGFYHQTSVTENGTVIQTITNDGHDTIRISPKPLPKPEIKLLEEEVEYSEYIAVGLCYDTAGFTNRAVAWFGLDAEPTDLGVLDGWMSSVAYDISDDGETIVGACHNGTSFPYGEAFRWTKAEGMVSLGFLSENVSKSMAAHSVNADGTVIVGQGTLKNVGANPWVWRKDEGLKPLPTYGVGMPQATPRWRVSPNGRYIAGHINVSELDNSILDGVYWLDDEGPKQVPRPGTTSMIEENTPPLIPRADSSFPLGVNDEGEFIGGINHVILNKFNYYGLYLFPWLHSTIYSTPPENTMYIEMNPPKESVFRWDSEKDVYQIVGDGWPTRANTDGTIVGYLQTEFIEPYHKSIHILNTDVLYEDSYELFSPYVTDRALTGWKLAKDGTLTYYDKHTKANDITDDDEVIVGCTTEPESFRAIKPVWWNASGEMNELKILQDHDSGEANAVVVVTKRIKTNTSGLVEYEEL